MSDVNAAIQFAEEDLEQWRTDKEAGSATDEDSTEDDENDDEDVSTKQDKLAKSLIRAANPARHRANQVADRVRREVEQIINNNQ